MSNLELGGDLERDHQRCVGGNEAYHAALTSDGGLRKRDEVHMSSAAMCWGALSRATIDVAGKPSPARRNHVGLLSEDIDPLTGELCGNFLQTCLHVVLRLSRSWEEGLWRAS